MRSFDWKAGLPFALALAATVAIPQDAFAQFFFRPFANIFRAPIPSEGPPAYASRPAVASILGRTGFQLVGPLGRRGDQIVATGVSRREGEMRFIIDPYAGRILRAVRLGPPPRRGAPDAPATAGGPGPAGRGFDNAQVPEAAQAGARLSGAPNGPAQQDAAATKIRASSKTSRAIVPPKSGVAPAAQADKPASASPAPANAAQPSPVDARTVPLAPVSEEKAANPSEAASTTNASTDAADGRASVSQQAKPESAKSEAASAPAPSPAAQEPKPEAQGAATSQAPAAENAADAGAAPPSAQPPAKPAASAERSAPARRAAAARAASSRRAIAPPQAASGTTVVTPAASAPPAAGANGSATAPDDGKPQVGG